MATSSLIKTEQVSKLLSRLSYLDVDQRKKIQEALRFALIAHEGQKRKTGEDYYLHPLRTAVYLASLKLDSPTIEAALLHDVPEDTNYSLNDIRHQFGKEVAFLVDGVTKLGKIRLKKSWFFSKTTEEEIADLERQIETLRKMFVAMARDIRVILIKLADRLDNMKTLAGVDQEKRERISKETLEIYAPLAYRLGMGELKGQLEDLAFPYVYPNEYIELKRKVADSFIDKQRYINHLKKYLQRQMAKNKIQAEIHGRAKHFYSLYRKLGRYQGDLSKIYDLVALRIIVNSIEECYKVLGIIHKLWNPLPGRIKDYIALPKPNGYRSLHTTVFCLEGKICEIQIKTWQMHWQAENGIAAHWYYDETKGIKKFIKDKIIRAPKVPADRIVWVKELADWQKALKQGAQLPKELKLDFFSDRIFIYTPQGDVKDLPAGATPIDFAYKIHTDIGDKCVGAKINGKMIGLDKPLENGNVVEILTSKNAKGPKRDWLEFVRTAEARSKIRRHFKDLRI